MYLSVSISCNRYMFFTIKNLTRETGFYRWGRIRFLPHIILNKMKVHIRMKLRLEVYRVNILIQPWFNRVQFEAVKQMLG